MWNEMGQTKNDSNRVSNGPEATKQKGDQEPPKSEKEEKQLIFQTA